MYVLIMFDPKFPEGSALFIIWRRSRFTGLETVAAGTHRAMKAAWGAIQDEYPDEELTLQNRARVLEFRAPLRAVTFQMNSGPSGGSCAEPE